MGNVVVGVDESEGARQALRWAEREAGLHGWSLTAVLVWAYLDQHQVSAKAFDPSYGPGDAEAALRSIVTTTLGDGRASSVHLRAVCGLPARALLDASRDAELLVVGARGTGGFRGLLLGSVSSQVLHHASCPVAVVHDGKRNEVGRIVVGVDGSDSAVRALRWALQEARARGAVLQMVHAWHMPYVGGTLMPPPAEASLFRDSGERILETAVAGARDATDVQVEPSLVEGDAGGALLEAARAADLVVIGSRGRGGFRGLMLGSASHKVAQHSPCPVVIVPPAAPPE